MQYPTEDHTDIGLFITKLRQALAGPLPGVTAQLEMAPLGRESPSTLPRNVRQSAVLALLHGHDHRRSGWQDLSLVFTLRPTTLRHHGGQISFPGGGVEGQDTSLAETALRETSEELGISADGVDILGRLTPLYIAPSRNLVHPFLGWLPQLPRLDPDPVEVAAVFDEKLERLLGPENWGKHIWERHGETLTAPCYLASAPAEEEGNFHIWGATAMILSELLTVIRPLVSDTSRNDLSG